MGLKGDRRYSETDLKGGIVITAFLTLLLVIWLGVVLIRDIHTGLTQGFTTPVFSYFIFGDLRQSPVSNPAWVHLLVHLTIGIFMGLLLWWGFKECWESLDEIRTQKAQEKFDKVMERIQQGEDIDDILQDR